MKKITLLISALFLSYGLSATTCPNAQAGVLGDNALVCNGTNDISGIAGCGSTLYMGGQEALITFTPATTGSYDLAYSGQTWTGIFVWDACPTSGGVCVGTPVTSSASSKTMTVTLTMGVQYFIMVDTYPTPNSPCPGTLNISASPTCPNPTGAGSNTVTFNSANLTWTQAGGATNWDIEWGLDGFTPTGTPTINDTASNPYPLTGLATSTAYDYYVRADCGMDDTSDVSAWVGPISFTTTAPPPANDDFADSLPVACAGTYLGNTTTATSDNQPAVTTFGVSNVASRNVWYSYTGTGSEELVTLDLCNSSYDTAILVATGAPGSLTWVAGNDDSCGTRSLAQFTSDGTTTYHIMVRGYAVGSYGAYELNVTCEAAVPAPANNECADAEALTFTIPATGTTTGATQNGAEAQPSCDTFGAIADVWYSVTLAAASDLSVNTTLGTATEANVAIYSACGGLVADEIECSVDNGGESVTATGLAAGTYYVRVWNDGTSQVGTFDIVADFTLSNPDLNNQDAFTYFPNPVKNTLQLNAQSNIQNVSVYNMLGQEVLRTAPNNVNSTVDMSALQTGAYFVKVTINDVTETVRVIKQ